MPENEELITYIKRAFELRNQECYKQAIEMLYKAITIEPDNIEILFQLGELYYKIENYTRAEQFVNQILQIDGNHLNSLLLYKNICIKKGEYYSAKEIAEKIYAIDKSEQNLVSVVKIYGKLELFEELSPYEEEINRSVKCLYELALAYYLKSDYKKAQEILDTALKINNENDECKILQGKIFFDNNEPEKAKEVLSGFFENTNDAEILNFKGLFAMDDLDFMSAIKSFSKARNIDKNNPQYIYNLGNAYFLNGWYDEAVATYRDAINLSPDNSDYRYSLAYAYYEYGDYKKSKTEIEIILASNPVHSGANVIDALLKFKDNNFIEAERILVKNTQNGNCDEFTLSSLAKVQTELGKYEQAENAIKTVIANNSDNLRYRCDLADIFIAQKKYAEAEIIAKEIISKDENYIYAYIIGAKSAYLSEQYDEAKSYAQEVLSVDMNCAEGYYYLALVREHELDYDEAIECMRRAILYDVNNAGYYVKMAELYKANGDIDIAFEYVKEAESIDSSEKYKILFREYAKLCRK